MEILQAGAARTRHVRNPNFPVAGVMKPFGLYPIYAHPVLPGETMDSGRLKWRVLSKPVKHPLAGAWLETWLIYVKFTDIDRALGGMFVSDSFSSAGYTAGANRPRFFTKSGQIDWLKLITDRVAQSFFLHSGETILYTSDGVPKTKLNSQSWYQNLMFKPASVTLGQLPGDNPDTQLTGFQMMQMMAMSELTYESYLKQFGVQSIVTGVGEPEILRYTRSWHVPVNTVEPTTGVPSAAWVWSDDVEWDKPKRFDEPGFLIQYASVRPKMFQKNISYSFIGNLWGFSDFFPIYNIEDPAGGVRAITSADPTIATTAVTGGPHQFIYDHRDLLNHGEQFINCSDAETPFAIPKSGGLTMAVASTLADLQGEYVPDADIDALFSGAGATDKCVYYEGMATLNIKGHLKDTTVAR